jgi:beta-1,4-mannosyl-glycoprotein beta-1,4-N-acetylglucosaminyltransferase
VLVESELNHSGGPKELFFYNKQDRFTKWLHKIELVIVPADESPKDENNWAREKHQRQCILLGLKDVPDQSIVMISDIDEIPDLSKIPITNLPHLTTSVHMWMFEYSFKYLFTGEPWFGTVITTCENLKKVGPNYLRDNRWKFPSFKNSGWHLSSFGNGKMVANKVNTYAHSKDPHEIEWNPETFDKLIMAGMHTDGKTPLALRSDSVPLPGNQELLKKLNLI